MNENDFVVTDLLKKEIEDWEEERKWFQETNAFNFIRQHLDERLLVVVGNQESIRFLKTELDSFNNKDGVLRCCSLFLCVIHGGSLNHDKLMDETESEFYRTLKATFEAFDINQSISRKEVLDNLDTHLNIYLKKKDGQYSVLHHRLLDFLFYYFGQRYQQLIINFADSEMIRDRTVLQSLDIIPQEFTILIDGQNETDYIQRLVNDMLSDHINDVLYNHQMIHKDFRSKLVSHLQKLNDDDLTVTYVFSSIILKQTEKHPKCYL
ncbi:unnamed protein product [Mytilus edulis]|uniref:Uncharacterized protein n=1 Tax=Mytilus edulis TaxID=6550 RepID=A0A8S3RDX5_MYTED|nr:unnamed protein product [Mytilus edulis]